MWISFLAVVAIIHSMYEMIVPLNDFHFWINFGYSVISIIALALFGYSFKANVNLKIIIIPSILTITRYEVRMIDYENTMYDPSSPMASKAGRKYFYLT